MANFVKYLDDSAVIKYWEPGTENSGDYSKIYRMDFGVFDPAQTTQCYHAWGNLTTRTPEIRFNHNSAVMSFQRDHIGAYYDPSIPYQREFINYKRNNQYWIDNLPTFLDKYEGTTTYWGSWLDKLVVIYTFTIGADVYNLNFFMWGNIGDPL